MAPLSLRLVDSRRDFDIQAQGLPRKPLGRYLVNRGAISPDQLVKALHLQLSLNAPLGEVLVAEGWAEETDILEALGDQFGLTQANLNDLPPDPHLCGLMPAKFWMRHRIIPWMRDGEVTLVATNRPDLFDDVRGSLEQVFGLVAPVLAHKSDIARATATHFRPVLAQNADKRVPAAFSFRSRGWGMSAVAPLILFSGIGGLLLFPAQAFLVLSVLAIATFVLFAVLRITALAAYLLSEDPFAPKHDAPEPGSKLPNPRPKVSVLVPLFREKEIVGALIPRLARLTYPKALLDVVLVLEEKDDITRKTLRHAQLPPWMRVIEVPENGPLTTKPRAMNYALDFCDGEIIGVWDAEDAPASDQIERIVDRFADAPQDLACLQGILDFYNPRTNWLSRCFCIEYSAWFRVVLPGIARLGLVVPLGGTTLFMRRSALQKLGGWDAHNVTEDADLGMRICRAGLRTEMINTVTYEEANCRAWPWVKQRSRWLKGFFVTYMVHMRRPLALWREMGARRFASFQAYFLGTLAQFMLAPVLWSFWLVLMGYPHVLGNLMSEGALRATGAAFLAGECVALGIGVIGACRAERRYLIPFVPTMMFYFALGTFAAFKALMELVTAPCYWDKTQHGVVAAEPGQARRKRRRGAAA